MRERRKLGHSLRRIWRRFKRKYPDPTLGQFDDAIGRLDRFEELRYPERTRKEGLNIGFSCLGVSTPPTSSVMKLPPFRPLSVDDVDRLVAEAFRLAGVNPRFFSMGLNRDADKYLKHANPNSIW